MKYIAVILVALILSSCSPQKRLGRLLDRFPPDTTIHIEVRDTTIFRDTTIYKTLPGDTVFSESIIETKHPLPYTEVTAETDLAFARAWVLNSDLRLELEQKDSVFQFILDSAIINHHDTVFIKQTILVDKPIPPKPFWKIGFLISGILLILIVSLLILRK